jgi:hypothetical protein
MVEKRLKDLKTLYKKPGYNFLSDSIRYGKIYNDIKNNGYDYKKSKIIVSSDNFIINGHHRHYILKSIYNDDYVIKVIKVPINRLTYLVFYNILFISVLPIILLLFLISKLFKKKNDDSVDNIFDLKKIEE